MALTMRIPEASMVALISAYGSSDVSEGAGGGGVGASSVVGPGVVVVVDDVAQLVEVKGVGTFIAPAGTGAGPEIRLGIRCSMARCSAIIVLRCCCVRCSRRS